MINVYSNASVAARTIFWPSTGLKTRQLALYGSQHELARSSGVGLHDGLNHGRINECCVYTVYRVTEMDIS